AGTLPEQEVAGLLERYRAIDLLISPAQHLAQRLERFGVTGIEVIRNPVDLERFCPGEADRDLVRRWGIEAQDVVAAHFSNMKWIKRAADFVTAAERALQEQPNLLFLLVGDGPARADAEALCRRRGLERRFRFVGWIDHGDVPAYLNLSDIVVLPSEDD